MRRLLLILAIALTLAVTTSATLAAAGRGVRAGAAVPEDGLVLRYVFERLTGGLVQDQSGNSVDGHIIGANGSRMRAPSLSGYGYAIQLHGDQHQYVDVPLLPVLDVDSFTLAAWVRYTGVQNDRTNGRWEVLEKAGAYWMNVRTDGHVRVGGFFGGCSGPGVWQFLDSAQSLATGTWKHVATSYDGSTLTVYVDGVPSASKPVSGRTCISGEPLAVGAKNNPSKGLLEAFWDGRLDEVRVYDRALTPQEIAALADRSPG
jgi:hypothetical protein